MKKFIVLTGILLLIFVGFLAFPTRTGTTGRTLHKVEQAVASVAKSTTSDEQEITLVESRVMITYIAVDASASEDFDLEVYNKTGGTLNTIDTVYHNTTNTTGFFSDNDFPPGGLSFINRDTTEAKTLYFKIKNDDTTNASTFNILIHYYYPRVR